MGDQGTAPSLFVARLSLGEVRDYSERRITKLIVEGSVTHLSYRATCSCADLQDKKRSGNVTFMLQMEGNFAGKLKTCAKQVRGSSDHTERGGILI